MKRDTTTGRRREVASSGSIATIGAQRTRKPLEPLELQQWVSDEVFAANATRRLWMRHGQLTISFQPDENLVATKWTWCPGRVVPRKLSISRGNQSAIVHPVS